MSHLNDVIWDIEAKAYPVKATRNDMTQGELAAWNAGVEDAKAAVSNLIDAARVADAS